MTIRLHFVLCFQKWNINVCYFSQQMSITSHSHTASVEDYQGPSHLSLCLKALTDSDGCADHIQGARAPGLHISSFQSCTILSSSFITRAPTTRWSWVSGQHLVRSRHSLNTSRCLAKILISRVKPEHNKRGVQAGGCPFFPWRLQTQ